MFGGFVVLILIFIGSGNYVVLFSYFVLFNVGIFVIVWFCVWWLFNLVGFVGIFGIGFVWGLCFYILELFVSIELFLVLFFLMYVGIGLFFVCCKLLEVV